MEQKEFSLTDEVIYAAEEQRSRGNNAAAVEAVKIVREFPPNDLGKLSENEQKRYLMAARILAVAYISLANRSWSAPAAADYLGEAKSVITDVYRNPRVQESARDMKTDTQNNPYEFGAEMVGDEAAYTLVLAALTGNTTLLDLAAEKMGQTALDKFRLGRVRPETTNDQLRRNYEAIADEAQTAGQWERVATVAAQYVVDMFKRGQLAEAARGVSEWLKAVKYDRTTASILPRQVVKAMTETARHRLWQVTTPAGEDYGYLQLPL